MGPLTTTLGATARGRGPEIEGIPLLCAYSSVLSNGKWPLLLEERSAAPVTGKGRALHQYSEGSRPHRPIADYGFGVCGWAGFEVCGWAEDPAGSECYPARAFGIPRKRANVLWEPRSIPAKFNLA